MQLYGKTRGEVRNKITAVLKEAKRKEERYEVSTTGDDGKETVTQYLKRWYPEGRTKNGPLHQKSLDSRVVNINRMNPHIGDIILRDLRAIHIRDMYNALRENGLTDASVRQAHSTLNKALNDAKVEGAIPINPMHYLVNKPTVKHPEREPLTIAEVDKLLSVNDRWTPLFTLLVHTGLRRGEALGLSWDKVDLEGEPPSLKVVRALVSTRGGTKFSEPKTEKSRRAVTLNPSTVTALKVQKLQAHDGPDNLVFPNMTGGSMEPAVVNRALDRTLLKAGINKKVRVHDLRLTCGSLMHQDGADSKEIQEILGHEDIQTTLNIYVKPNLKTLKGATDRLHNVLGKKFIAG
jgi:integrase